MNKKTAGRSTQKVVRVTALGAAALVLLVLGGFLYNEISNHQTADRIASDYHRVQLPPTLRLHDKKFTGTPFLGASAAGVGWSYEYQSTIRQTMQQANDSLRMSLTKAGFTIPTEGNGMSADAYGNVGLLAADRARLYLLITINAVNDSNSPDAVVSTIEVNAYE